MRLTPCTILLLALATSGPLPLTAQTATQSARPRSRTAASTPAKPAAPATAAATAATPTPCTCATIQTQRHLPPYSAKQETKQVQTLPDGTTITHTTEALMWRDADGRTRTDTLRTQADGTEYHYVNLTDPVAGIRMNWIVGGPSTTAKVVTVYSLQPTPQPAATPTPPVPQPARRYYPYRQESLPPTTIDDVYVEGYRYTRTTPAGYDGNDHDITTVSEYWTAPDLGLSLRRITDDPRTGKSTTETTDLKHAAPDPALFKAPDGYEVKKATQ